MRHFAKRVHVNNAKKQIDFQILIQKTGANNATRYTHWYVLVNTIKVASD